MVKINGESSEVEITSIEVSNYEKTLKYFKDFDSSNLSLKVTYSDDSTHTYSKDELLQLLLDGAEEDAIAITGNPDIKDDLPNTIAKMVVYNYNRLGTEGLDSETYSGVRYDYSSSYSDEILEMLNTKSRKKGFVYFV